MQAPAPTVRPAALTPLLAQPEVLPAAVGEIVPTVSGATGDPLAGLDVLDAGPSPEPLTTDSGVVAEGTAPQPGAVDWLSPEGALRGEFGDLVENIPRRPAAQAPVFPTPPAPWPALVPNVPTIGAGAAPAGPETVPDLDAGFEDVLGAGSASGGVAGSGSAASGVPAAMDDTVGPWTPDTGVHVASGYASGLPDAPAASATDAEVWAESYGAEADAIHGDLQPAADEPTWPEPGVSSGGTATADPATYLALEWPEPPATDPSTLPTPVMPGPAVLPGWEAAAREPAGTIPAQPAVDAARPLDDDAFGWGRTPQETPAPASGMDAIDGAGLGASSGGTDEWAFAAADTGADLGGRPVVTASSLAAAEALERVAVQLREGTLRADGFSPALGEAAALSAVLAALLGVDARWDVQR